MSKNRNLFEEAIADAKAIKDMAIANAKAALEESFTPHLQKMLSTKLQELEQEDLGENIDETEDENLGEAKKDEESDTEEVIVADTEEGEVPAEGDEDMTVTDTQVDVNMDGVPDVDTGSAESKKAFTSLVDTYNSAKELGDPKLTQMIANALTYYNKNIILKSGQPQA